MRAEHFLCCITTTENSANIWYQAAVCSNAVVLFLLIHCLFLLQVFVAVLCLLLVLLCSALNLESFLALQSS